MRGEQVASATKIQPILAIGFFAPFVCLSKVAGVALHRDALRLQHALRRCVGGGGGRRDATASQPSQVPKSRCCVCRGFLSRRSTCISVARVVRYALQLSRGPTCQRHCAVAHATSLALSAVRCLATAYAAALSPARAASPQPLQTIHATRS